MRSALLPLSAAVLFGCTKGQPAPQGSSEPFRVRGAQFIAGKLPGLEPSDAGPAPVGEAGTEQGPPHVTQFGTTFSYVFQGQNAPISGLITANGWAVGLQMVGIGTGYWVIPAGDPDPASKTNELSWSASCDFATEIPAGYQAVRAVALDHGGRAGPQLQKRLCVGSIIGDSLTPCDPTIPPAEAIIALRWDTNVDLDLQVVTPDGSLVSPKKNSTTVDPGEAGALPPDAGALDRDSNAGCIIDGIRHEDLIWKNVAPTGRYLIYVNLFDACKQPAVRFEASVYTAIPSEDIDGGKVLQQWWKQGGELLDFQANAGAAMGLYVSEFDFF